MLDINNGKALRFEIVHYKPIKNVIGTMNSGNNCQYVSNNPNSGNQSPFNVVAPNMTEEKKKKNKKKRETSPISLSSKPKHSSTSGDSVKKVLPLLKAKSIK